MTDVWLTARAIAELCLPGLPGKRAVQVRAKREGWPHRDRQGQGGGREYPVSALPAVARTEFARRQLISAARAAPPVPIIAPAATHQLKGWQRQCLEARAAVLAEVDWLALTAGLVQARLLVERESAAGTLEPGLQRLVARANDRQGSRAGVSAVTLKRWHKLRARGGVAALAPKPAKVARADAPAWMPYFLELYQIHGQPSVAACWEKLPGVLPQAMAVPPLRTVQRGVQQLPELDRNRGRMGKRALKALRAYVARDVSELWPTAIYVPDGHTLKAPVAHPIHGRPFKPEITTIVDVCTRRAVGWSAALAETAIGTLDAYRHAFETSGVCDIAYSDRGRGFNNELFDEAATGFFARWGVTKKQALAYGSQARGVIERIQGSIWVRAARFLPAYAGRDADPEIHKAVSTRIERDIEARGASPMLMSWDEFRSWAQSQIEAYNDRPHSELPKLSDPTSGRPAGRARHQSPNQAWQAAVAAGWEPDLLSAADHPDLYRPQIQRRVSRCIVDFNRNQYFHADLTPYHDRDVLVGYDIHDAARVWVSTLDQTLICVAAWNGHRTSYMPVSVIADAHERRVAGRIKRGEKRIVKIRAERGPGLIEHAPAVALPEITEAEREAVVVKMMGGKAAPVETAEERFARAQALAARQAAGADLDDRDLCWLTGYRGSAEYRAQMRMEELRERFRRQVAAAG